MPEGHVIHRLAGELTQRFGNSGRGPALDITSPQGRFAREAAIVDQSRLLRADAHGKHLFIDFDVDHPEHIIYIHLGLIGTLQFEPVEETRGQIRLHISDGTVAANLRGPPVVSPHHR